MHVLCFLCCESMALFCFRLWQNNYVFCESTMGTILYCALLQNKCDICTLVNSNIHAHLSTILIFFLSKNQHMFLFLYPACNNQRVSTCFMLHIQRTKLWVKWVFSRIWWSSTISFTSKSMLCKSLATSFLL